MINYLCTNDCGYFRRAMNNYFLVVMSGLLCLLCSCGQPKYSDEQLLADWRQRESGQRRLHEGGEWHFEFDTVRLYRTNWDYESWGRDIVSDGNLIDSREPEDGILLTSAQVDKLEAAVTGSHPEADGFTCYYPHHAFVFFDKEGSIVGSIDICFICGTYYGRPAEFVPYWDLLSIAELIHEAGVPLRNPAWN